MIEARTILADHPDQTYRAGAYLPHRTDGSNPDRTRGNPGFSVGRVGAGSAHGPGEIIKDFDLISQLAISGHLGSGETGVPINVGVQLFQGSGDSGLGGELGSALSLPQIDAVKSLVHQDAYRDDESEKDQAHHKDAD